MSEKCKVIFPISPKEEREDVFEDSNEEGDDTELVARFSTLYEVTSDMYDMDPDSFIQFGYISERPHIILFVKSHDGVRHGIAIDREALLASIVGGFSDMRSLLPQVEDVLAAMEDDSSEEEFNIESDNISDKDIPEAC